MFSDPLVAVMTMLLLFFAGVLLVFLFLTRAVSSLKEDFRDAMRKQQMFLSDVEQQLVQLQFGLRALQEDGGAAAAAGGQKPLEDVSFLRQEDPLLSMLEAGARRGAASPGIEDDQLLPPPQKARPIAEDYDPAHDPKLFEDSFFSEPETRLKRGG